MAMATLLAIWLSSCESSNLRHGLNKLVVGTLQTLKGVTWLHRYKVASIASKALHRCIVTKLHCCTGRLAHPALALTLTNFCWPASLGGLIGRKNDLMRPRGIRKTGQR